MSVDGGVQSITLIHGPSSLLPPVLLLYDRPPAIPLFPSHLRCTVTSLIPGRQADGRTLKPCSQRAFPIFHLRSTGRRDPSIRVLSFLSPSLPPLSPAARPSRNKTAATERIDASRCKFVLFFTPGHPAAAFASPRLASPCCKPANKGFLLQRRRSELDRPLLYFVLYKSYTSKRHQILYYCEKLWRDAVSFRRHKYVRECFHRTRFVLGFYF